MYANIYMFICVYKCVYIYTHTRTHTLIYIYICMYVCIYIYPHTHTHIYDNVFESFKKQYASFIRLFFLLNLFSMLLIICKCSYCTEVEY